MTDRRINYMVRSRRYWFEHWLDGVAQLVVGQSTEEAVTRRIGVIVWWPENEGPHWPSAVFEVPFEQLDEAWDWFRGVMSFDDKYRWEDLPEDHRLDIVV